MQFRDTFPSHADGRAHLASMSNLGVPRYVELDDPYPLTLITPATAKTINSMFGEFQPADPAVHLHPDDATSPWSRRRRAGAWCATTAPRSRPRCGSMRRCGPGVVAMPKGSWCRDFAGGLTANALTPATLSDLADGACFNDTRVEVVAAG